MDDKDKRLAALPRSAGPRPAELPVVVVRPRGASAHSDDIGFGRYVWVEPSSVVPAVTRGGSVSPPGSDPVAPVGVPETPHPAAAIAAEYGLSRAGLAVLLGLPAGVFFEAPAITEPARHRLDQFLTILGRVEPTAGGPRQALSWYRETAIPSLGSQTAAAVVARGDGPLVLSYLDGTDHDASA